MYLLLASETGIVGLLIFIYILYFTIKRTIKIIVSHETMYEMRLERIAGLSILISYILIGFFDHYLLTIQQGQLLIWVLIGWLII
jgi:O-antigen ligase